MSYELMPTNGQKSFYGRAWVMEAADHATLFSYGTPVISIDGNGKLWRHWEGWSATTGKHIKAFCGLNKAEFMKLEVSPYGKI